MVNGNNHQILNIKFIGAQAQSLAGIKATADLANIKPNVTSLNNLLETIMRGSRDYRVSHLAHQCVQSFTNQGFQMSSHSLLCSRCIIMKGAEPIYLIETTSVPNLSGNNIS